MDKKAGVAVLQGIQPLILSQSPLLPGQGGTPCIQCQNIIEFIVQFHLCQSVSHLQLVDDLETEFWKLSSKGDEIVDRLTAGEAAFDAVAAKYSGAWEYLKSDAHCAEFH